MRELVDERLRMLARRAGMAGMPPAVMAGALVMFGVAVVLAAWRWWPRDNAFGVANAASTATIAKEATASPAVSTGASASGAPGGASASASTSGEASASASVWVHVVGAVNHAGVYRLATGSRVADAVDAAGGLSGNAAQAGVNLAREVADGEQVVVPTQDEFAGGAAAVPVAPTAPSAGGSGASAATGPVNINTADAAALDTLPGVGPSTAEKIVADRQANGPFASPDDLGRVSGIGPKKLEQLKVLVSVR